MPKSKSKPPVRASMKSDLAIPPVATKAARSTRPAPVTLTNDPVASSPVPKIPGVTAAPPVTPTAAQPSGLSAASASSDPAPPAVRATTSKAPSIPGVADVAPSVTAPKVPDGFIPTKRTGVRGYYPSRQESAALPGALKDLGRFTDYQAVLGTAAANVAAVSASISQSIQWRKLRNASEAWDEYVRTQDALAWKGTVTLLDKVRPLFLLAARENPALAAQYPWLAQLFNAPKVAAKQASATRAKKAKAAVASAATATETAAEAATNEAIAAATAAANAATEAAHKLTSATTTAPKAVTVNT